MPGQDIHVRIQIRPSGNELNITTSGPVYMKLRDSLLGHFLGLRYDYTSNNWQFFINTGGDTVNIPIAMVDAYIGFNFHALVQANGTVVINIYHSNTFYGSITTPTAWIFDSLLIGAMDNTGGEAVRHFYTSVTVGSTAGGNQYFPWAILSGDTLPLPFQSMVGGTFAALVSTSEIQIQNSGDENAYLLTQWFIQAPPPTPNPLVDPGDPHIVLVGNSDWAQSAQPAWVIDEWGLDTLHISVRGSRRTRDAFLNSLTPWMTLPADANMFLSHITQEQRAATNFPQIELVFVGKRGGILPPNKEQQGEQVQQISGRSLFNFAHTLGLTFIGKTSEQTVWSRSPIDLSTVNPLEPSQIDLMWITETDTIFWAGVWEAYESIIETNANAMFVSRLVWTGVSEEVVPGQYYRATRTLQRLYFPILT